MTYNAGLVGYNIMMQAQKSFGVVVNVEPNDFLLIVNKQDDALIIFSKPAFLSKSYKYVTNYKGFVFFTKSKEILQFSSRCEVIESKSIHTPEI